jgi:hypothetical protein
MKNWCKHIAQTFSYTIYNDYVIYETKSSDVRPPIVCYEQQYDPTGR